LQRNYGALALKFRASLKRECRDPGQPGNSATVPAAVIAIDFLKFLATVHLDGKAFKKGRKSEDLPICSNYFKLSG
jgi:hypothetical protein